MLMRYFPGSAKEGVGVGRPNIIGGTVEISLAEKMVDLRQDSGSEVERRGEMV